MLVGCHVAALAAASLELLAAAAGAGGISGGTALYIYKPVGEIQRSGMIARPADIGTPAIVLKLGGWVSLRSEISITY